MRSQHDKPKGVSSKTCQGTGYFQNTLYAFRLYVQQFMGLLGIDTQVHEAALDRAFERWRTEYTAGEAGKARKGSFISSIISSAVEFGMDWALPTP